MVAYWELSKTHLLVLLAANLEPLKRFSDGRWRTADRHFPPEGLAATDVEELEANGFVECYPGSALISDKGRAVLKADPTSVRLSSGGPAKPYVPTQRPYQ